MKVKLCGFTESRSLLCAIEHGAAFVGLVFVENSPRNISLTQAKSLRDLIPSSVKKVAVVVNSSPEELKAIRESFEPDFWQFHGQENPNFLQKIRQTFPNQGIIKAFAIDAYFKPSQLKPYENLVDYFLFDGKKPGSGQSFDWQDFSAKFSKIITETSQGSSKKPWFLSGGLNLSNLESAVSITKAKFIDISSGIEEEKGKKSCQLIAELMNKINKI